MACLEKEIEEQLAQVRVLPFIWGLRFLPGKNNEADGTLELTTPQGRYRLSVEIKRSYLSRSLVNAILSRGSGRRVGGNQKESGAGPDPIIVMARYIPPAAGEQFVNSGISFVDDPGNIHVRLGAEYNWTVLGKREPPRPPEANRTTPATMQLLFEFAINPASVTWTVRDLARASGISKTKVAQLRRQFLHERILTGESELRMTPALTDRLVSDYSRILRPKLLIGRYRYPDASADQFLTRLSEVARAQKIPYAITGGPAVEAMQFFYHGEEVSLFLDANPGVQRLLRLLPDRAGPLILLRPFGEVVCWKEIDGRMVAPPWLVYAELLSSGDPRAREAAEELRRGFLE